MVTTKKTFVFNSVWYEIIAGCSAQVKGEVFASVMEYALYGKMPENISNEANVIFCFIKIEIDRREKRRVQRIKAKETADASAPAEITATENAPETSATPTPSPSSAPPAQVITRQQRRYNERHPESAIPI